MRVLSIQGEPEEEREKTRENEGRKRAPGKEVDKESVQ